jgi:hypothetical protein
MRSDLSEHYCCVQKGMKNHIRVIQGGPDITCQKNSGSLEGSNKSKKPIFIRSKIVGIN